MNLRVGGVAVQREAVRDAAVGTASPAEAKAWHLVVLVVLLDDLVQTADGRFVLHVQM